MFKTTDELKSFILWAKSTKVLQLKVGDIEVIFAPHALQDANEPDLTSPVATKTGTEEKNTSKLLVDDMQADIDDEELLFHSAGR